MHTYTAEARIPAFTTIIFVFFYRVIHGPDHIMFLKKLEHGKQFPADGA
jgi:hypothetical protein